jgi:hypothetical protein
MGDTKAAEDLFPPRIPATCNGVPLPFATPGEFVTHLRAEIDRLTADRDRALTQVRAEQEHNRRLALAFGLMRSAAHTLMAAISSIPDEDYDRSCDTDDATADISKADALVLPTANP